MGRSNDETLKDFEGEFGEVKEMTEEELKNDRLIKRLRIERKLKDIENGKQPSSEPDRVISLDTSDQILHLDSDLDKPSRHYGHKRRGSDEDHQFPTNESKKNAPVKKHKAPIVTGGAEFFKRLEKEEEKKRKRKEKHKQKRKTKHKLKSEDQSPSEEEDSNDHSIENNNNDDFMVELPNHSGDEKDPQPTGEQAVEIKSELDFEVTQQDVENLKTQVIAQLINKTTNFPNLTKSPALIDQFNEVYHIFEHTVKDREGHSALVIGPRSSGKSAIVERALNDLLEKYKDEFIVIRLSAYLHSDDNIALREIARQLDYHSKKFNNDEDNETLTHKFEQRGISDTFNNILAILDDAPSNSKDSDQSLQSAAIIFVIDEFEKYTGNNKQALLYNLFDLSQTSSIPICILGISTKITTGELLEKRVKSRFSQRIISINRPKTVEEFWENAKLNLIVDDKLLGNEKYTHLWNEHINKLFNEKSFGQDLRSSSNLLKIVYQIYFTTKNFKEFNNNCIYPVSRLSIESPFLRDSDFTRYLSKQSTNNIQDIIKSLSTLELLLVIAAARFIERIDLQVINFNMAYKEYEDMMKLFNMASTTSNNATTNSYIDNIVLTNLKVTQKTWLSKVLKNSWETLYKLGVIIDVVTQSNELNAANNNINKNFIIEENKMVQLDVTLEELAQIMEDSTVFKKLTKL